MAEHTLGWTAGDRRTGGERRVAVMERLDERRLGERRSGEDGHAQDPIAALFEGLEGRDASQFVPPERPERRGLAAAAARVVPPHEVHDEIPSLAAVMGHPVHPMLVPLPIGAFIGALAADVALAATGDRFFARAGRLMTAAGLATGAAAGISGAVDFVGRGQVRAHPASWLHLGGNAAVMALGVASLGVRARAGDDPKAVLPAALALSATAGALLVVTGWFGGELSYRHRVGVTRRDSA